MALNLKKRASDNTKTDGMGHKIKQRRKANDVFVTPRELGAMHIKAVQRYLPEKLKRDNDAVVWYDPFRFNENGTYFSQFPSSQRKWAEIDEGRDFFHYNPGHVDVLCSNPPYSVIDKVFKRSCELQPHIISYLIGVNNLTSRRLEMMNKAGYKLAYIKMLKVYKWFGMSFVTVFVKADDDDVVHSTDNVIDYDRKVWREIVL